MPANNPFPKSITGQVKNSANGFYTVGTSIGDYLRVPSAVGRANENDIVEIAFGDPVNKRNPVIISNSSVIISDSNRTESSSGIIVIETKPGIWLQHLGGWWLPRGQSLNPINALDGPFQQAVIGGPVVFEEITPGVTFVIHFPVLAKIIFPSDSWTIYADAVQYSDETGTPYARTSFGGSSPRPDLGIPVDHSIIVFSGSPFTGSEVWTADYTPRESAESPKILTVTGYVGDAADSANYFGGLVLFPNGADQIFATLETLYANTGPLPVTGTYREVINFVTAGSENPPTDQVEGLYFQPTYDPNDMENGFTVDSYSNSSSISGFSSFVFYEYSPGTVGLANVLNFGATMTLYYLYGNGNNISGQYEQFTGDGVTDTFVMPSNGGPQLYAAGSLGNISGPSIVIRSVNVILINGSPEFNYTVNMDTITLPSPPGMGDNVEFFFDYEELGYFNETRNYFDLYASPTAITADQSPIEYALNLDHVEGGPQTILEFLSINTNKQTYSVTSKWYAGDFIDFEYTYNTVTPDDYYNISGLRILHSKDPGGPTLQLDIPISPAVSANPVEIYHPEIDKYRTNTGSSYTPIKSLSLFYDPSIDSFTVTGPTGLIWRSRTQLGDPAPTPPTPAAHFTLTPWPNDGLTTSKKWEVGVEVARALPRRDCPWLGFSCTGDMGIQATWHNTGGLATVNYEDQGDSEGESDFLVRFWKRNSTTRAWSNTISVSILSYIEQGVSGSGLMVLESGATGPYGKRNNNPYTYSDAVLPDFGAGVHYTYQAGTGYRAYTKDRKAVFLPVSWLKLKPSRDFEFGADYGYEEAGFVLNAVNPLTGAVIAQFTQRSDKVNQDDLFVDPTERIADEIADWATANAAAIDKYVNYNPIYWPPGSGLYPASPHLGGIMWAAENRFQSFLAPGLPWFLLDSPVTGGSEFIGDVGYPPPPHLSGNQDNLQVDDSGNLYFSLNIPFYVRSQDLSYMNAWRTKTYTQPSQFFAGGTVSSPGYPGNQMLYIPAIDGSFNNLFISRAFDVYVNGVGPQSAIYRPTITGIAELLKGVVIFRGATNIGPDPGNPGSYIWLYPDVNVYFSWEAPEANPAQSTTITTTYTGLPSPCFEFPTFLGFQCSPMPYNDGLKIATFQPQWRKNLIVRERTYLLKVKWNGTSFQELWRKDITQRCRWPHAYSFAGYSMHVACPYGEVCYATIARGRFIFTVRIGTLVEPPNLDLWGNVTGLSCFLDAYENLDTLPATRLHHIELYPGNAGPKYVSVDVDSSGRECVNVWLDGSSKMYSIRFGVNINDPPTVVAHDEFDHSPHDYNFGAATLARNQTSYYWRSYDAVKKHTPS